MEDTKEVVAPANAVWQARLVGAVKSKFLECGVDDPKIQQQAAEVAVQAVLVELILLGKDLDTDARQILEDAEKDSEIARGRIHAGNLFSLVGETLLGVVVNDD